MKLTPSQAARLAEMLDFLHRHLTLATENIHANEEGTQVTLGFADWQRVLAVQMLLARYVRAVAEPEVAGGLNAQASPAAPAAPTQGSAIRPIPAPFGSARRRTLAGSWPCSMHSVRTIAEDPLMAERSFVHLHCHSHYSLLDGASRVPELVAHAKELGMNALALTDHGNLYGAIEFYRECKAAGINPIIGYEAYVAPGKRTEREARRRGEAGYHLTLLAQNRTGFKNLIKMASIAFLEGYHYVPRIDKELLEAHKEGLICLTGCASSEFSEYILKDQLDEATELAEWFHQLFGKNFYVEIQNNGLDIQKRCAEGAIDIANRLGLPLVATSDAHYLCQADSRRPRRAAVHQHRQDCASDENRMRYGSDQFYVRAAGGDVRALPRATPTPCSAARRSPTAAHIELDFKKRHFPVFTPPEGKTPEDYLRELCEAGPARALRRQPAAGGRRPAGARAGHHLPDGLRQLLPDRLGLRALRRGERHPGQRPRLGVRRPRQLRPQAQPRRSAGIRPAVRALPRPEPQRGARHRHRLLPGPPRGGDRLRPAEVRRGQRGPDRHLRHDGGRGGDQGRRPGPRRAARPRQPADRA